MMSVLLVISLVGFDFSDGFSAGKSDHSSGSKQASNNGEKGQIKINAKKKIGDIDPKIFGMHIPAWNETLYQNGSLRPNFLKMAKEAGFGYLVYPGGNYSASFKWDDMNLPGEIDTDQFLDMANKLNAKKKITVNYKASPKLAADWVRYVNKEKGENVKYWEVVDEPYLLMSASDFIEKMKTFVPKMKEADPNIKIVANVSMYDPDFTKQVIDEVGDMIDVYSIHILEGSPSADNKEKFYEDLLKLPNKVQDQLKTLKGWVTDVYPDKNVDYQIGSYSTVASGPKDWSVNSLPSGLWTADMLGTFATEQVDAAAYWALMNPYPPGQGDFGIFSPEMKPYVAYYPFVMFNQHFGKELVENKTQDAKNLSTYTSTSKDGKDLYVMMINKSPDKDTKVDLKLGNFKPRGDAEAWILDGPTNADHVYDYGLRKQSIKGIGQKTEQTIPAYSVVSLKIPGRNSDTKLDQKANLALNKTAKSSSDALKTDTKYYNTHDFEADKAIDGNTETRWASRIFQNKNEWFQVDLGQKLNFNQIKLNWEYPATKYNMEVSNDGENWTKIGDQTDAKTVKDSPQPTEIVELQTIANARYVRISMKERPAKTGAEAGSSQWTPDAFSLWEFGVYLNSDLMVQDIEGHVKQLEKNGEIKNDKAAHLLETHLKSVRHYESEMKTDKVIKHMDGFKTLLAHQNKEGKISEKAYDVLKNDADLLLKEWQSSL